MVRERLLEVKPPARLWHETGRRVEPGAAR